jgi:MFS family permease
MAIGLAIFMFAVDMSIVALALPVMGQAFGQTDAAMSAVVVCYTLTMALLILPYGLLIIRWPPLATFVAGVLGFAVASVLCALAGEFQWLLAGRVAQGVFGALLGTQAAALATAVVTPQERGRAMGVIASIGPLGAVTGPGLGGVLLSTWGWPSIFLVNAPLSLVIVALAFYSLRGVTYGAQPTGGLQPMNLLLREASFLGALLILLTSAAIGGGLSYLLPFALQDVHGLPPTVAGVTLLCVALGMAITSPVGGYLTDRYGVRRLLPAGLLTILAGSLILLLVIGAPTAALDLNWRLLLIGVGNGLVAGPLQTLIMSIGPRATLGAASALSSVARQLGFVGGPLLVSLLWSLRAEALPAERMQGGLILLVALAFVALAGAWYTLRRLGMIEGAGSALMPAHPVRPVYRPDFNADGGLADSTLKPEGESPRVREDVAG